MTDMKIAVAQISTDAGNISVNRHKIVSMIKKAKSKGADIIIFPELSIPGYMSLDLMLCKSYVADNLKALKSIIQYSTDILVIVGFIDQDKKKIGPDGTPVRYNSAALAYNGKLLAIVDKTLLPNYDVFFENRYFGQGRGREPIEFKGIKLGIQICEDLWDENYPIKVSNDLIKKGAQILINISGSPFYLGKRFDREKLIKKVCRTHKIPFIYVNTVGVQDGYDGELIFDGQSMVFNKSGNLIYLGKQFEEELLYVNVLDLESNEKELGISENNSMEELFNGLSFSIKEYFRRNNFSKAFIGISGGIDSAVVAALTVNALNKENVTLIYMPSPFSSKQSLKEVKKLTGNLDINLKIIPIDGIYRKYIDTFKKDFHSHSSSGVTEENIQARIRGMILMAYANKFNGLVISTANKTETALGYTTLYGDMCGAIAPIADVSKLNVYELAEYINKKSKKEIIPKTTIDRIPTAELRNNQTDEGSLGGSYELISPLVDGIIEERIPRSDLIKKYPKELVDKISNLISKSEYKRRQAAPAVKVTRKAFGLGRRIPISHKYKN